MPRLVVLVVEGTAWLAVVTGLYLIFISSVTALEVAVSLTVGALCAAAAVAGRLSALLRYRPALRWVRWLVPLPATVVADTVRLARLLARQIVERATGRAADQRERGGLRTLRLSPDTRGETAAARRALAMLVVSSTPGTYVVDVDPEEGILLVHALGEEPSRVEEVLTS